MRRWETIEAAMGLQTEERCTIWDFEWKYELPKELRIVIKNYEERYTTTPTKDIMTGCGADRERERESGIDDGFALGQLLKNGGLPVVGACDCPRPPC